MIILARSWLSTAQLDNIAGHLSMILQDQASLKLFVLQPIEKVYVDVFLFVV